MRLGITMFSTDQAMRPDALGRACEERGFVSLYFPEHTHIPTSRRTPPPTGDGVLKEEYRRTLDPFVALMAAAAATEHLLLGTGILLVAQRDPVVTAKAIATLDLLSGGRTVVGVGYGWNIDEMETHGVDPATRRARSAEHVKAMQSLWRDEIAEFHGTYVDLAPSWAWPKPVQQPGPPVLVGGSPGPKLFAHIAEYGDGWIPVGGGGVRAALPELAAAAEKVGRDPASLRVVPFGVMPDQGKLGYYESLGIDEVVLRLDSLPADEALPVLDSYAALVGSI